MLEDMDCSWTLENSPVFYDSFADNLVGISVDAIDFQILNHNATNIWRKGKITLYIYILGSTFTYTIK